MMNKKYNEIVALDIYGDKCLYEILDSSKREYIIKKVRDNKNSKEVLEGLQVLENQGLIREFVPMLICTL